MAPLQACMQNRHTGSSTLQAYCSCTISHSGFAENLMTFCHLLVKPEQYLMWDLMAWAILSQNEKSQENAHECQDISAPWAFSTNALQVTIMDCLMEPLTKTYSHGTVCFSEFLQYLNLCSCKWGCFVAVCMDDCDTPLSCDACSCTPMSFKICLKCGCQRKWKSRKPSPKFDVALFVRFRPYVVFHHKNRMYITLYLTWKRETTVYMLKK
jgi:hypothetical protein